MKKILKNKKFLLGFILGIFLAGTTGVLAATYYASKDVTYDNTESGMTSENVQDAIDELYVKAFPPIVDMGGIEIPEVTSGDGLYKDSYEDNVYTYRGANPNNYVTFNDELWRIISINTSDNTIKIMRNSILENRAYDTANSRSATYCNYAQYGCNIWGSSSTLYDTNLSPITTLAYQVGGTKYALPTAEAEVNTYLNTTYYNGLNSTAKNMVKQDAVYKSGVLKNQSGQTTSTDITQVNDVKWKGKVALIDATEYVRASTNSSCTGAYEYWYSSCYKNSSTHNWMYLNVSWWTMSPYSGSNSFNVWCVYGGGNLNISFADYAYGVRPVVTLTSNIQITGGDGTSSDPYTLGI